MLLSLHSKRRKPQRCEVELTNVFRVSVEVEKPTCNNIHVTSHIIEGTAEY